MNEASQLAFRAAEIMSERGHCKGGLDDAEGRVCFHGALNIAHHGDPGYADFQDPLTAIDHVAWEILAEREDGSFRSIIQYNDLPRVTSEDVILLLKQCGEKLANYGA